MRKRLPLIVLVIAGLGLLRTAIIRAQQPTTDDSQTDVSNAKPCIIVYGAVRSPARLELQRRVRLSEALAAAGGATDRASTVKVVNAGADCFQATRVDQVTKSASTSVQLAEFNIADISQGNQKSNPYLEAGDIVIVTELGPIYITGGVVNPLAIYPKEPLTLTQALKLAGGLRINAKTNKVVIYRKKDDSTEEITTDLNERRKDRTKDPVLQPFDIVDVPFSGPYSGPVSPYAIFDSRSLIPLPYRIIY
jgi:protein involved in polysaccharide export with SLBB domain